uniref:Reactive intermediate imine deaminase A homolog n=1 Tax=Leptobrachium leishanense TaxID=445787 RepID=A0A8C5MSL6_9ANUR
MAAIVRRIINTSKAPGAIGPYSQAVVVDKTMYVSGQIGMDPVSGQIVPGGVTDEATQALVNMGEILKAAGCDYTNDTQAPDNSDGLMLKPISAFSTNKCCYKYSDMMSAGKQVVKTTVLLKDINDFNAVNEIYKQFFRSNFPARAAYQAAALPRSQPWEGYNVSKQRRV